jgi:hypothetical protein
MARYIATVEYDAGEYWISFPGIQKAGSHAKRPEDIIPHARNFLNDRTKYGSPPPASLDDAITDLKEPFDGVRLVIFEWEPPPRTGYRVCGYDHDELVFEIPVPAEKIAQARALAQVPETDPDMVGSYPLTKAAVCELLDVPAGFGAPISVYVLEADR